MEPPFDPDRPASPRRDARTRTVREGLGLMWRDSVGRLLILGTGLITLFTCGVLVFALLMFGPIDFAEKTASENTATPPAGAQTQAAAPDAGALIVSGEISVEPNLPASLTLGEQPFALKPVNVAADGSLQVPADVEGAAFWVYGTLINYAVALPNTADNAVIMGALRVGDTIQLGLSRGQVLQFRVSNKLRVAPTATDLLAQTQPGLTLFLVGGVMTDRLVIQAQFVEPAAAGGTASPAGLNEPRAVGGVTVSVQAVRSVAQPSEVPPGWSYLVVDFTVRNDGGAAFSTAQANATLTDAHGQDYSATFQALDYATYPPLPDQIAAGVQVQASVGYLVPVGLAGPDLLWRFYPGAASAAHADFTLPYSPVSARIVVELTSAVLSEDGHDLNINGVIYNPSNLAATITRTDVTFRTETGEDITLRFFDPSFPWTVGPQAPPTPFTLTYVRPQGAKATLRIFDFVFQINLQE